MVVAGVNSHIYVKGLLNAYMEILEAGKLSSASWQSLHSLRHGDQCREDQADDEQHQWHQHRDQSEWTEAWDSHKLQIPGLSYNRWGFHAWDTLQDSLGNSSIDKAETNLDWQECFSQLQDTTDALPCHIHLPVCLWIMDPHSRASKKNTSHGNEVLPQDTTHLIQRPCYHKGSPCQDPAGNWTTWRTDDRKKMQTAVVWSCFPFIRSGQNHLARHSERGKKTRQTEEEVGRQHQGMVRPGVRQVPEGSGEQGKMEKTGCKIICGAPTTLAVKWLMMMMMVLVLCTLVFALFGVKENNITTAFFIFSSNLLTTLIEWPVVISVSCDFHRGRCGWHNEENEALRWSRHSCFLFCKLLEKFIIYK